MTTKTIRIRISINLNLKNMGHQVVQRQAHPMIKAMNNWITCLVSALATIFHDFSACALYNHYSTTSAMSSPDFQPIVV